MIKKNNSKVTKISISLNIILMCISFVLLVGYIPNTAIPVDTEIEVRDTVSTYTEVLPVVQPDIALYEDAECLLVLKDSISIGKVITIDERIDRYIANGRKITDREFKWKDTLLSECKKNNLPYALMLGIYLGESEFNPNNVNPSSGATGLGQVMRGTHRWLSKDIFKDHSNFRSMKNPVMNIKYTCKLMRLNIDERGTLIKALYAYGGCVSPHAKRTYLRYINNRIKKVTNSEENLYSIGEAMQV